MNNLSLEIPWERAQLKIYCRAHKCTVEYWQNDLGDRESDALLDKESLSCPGAGEESVKLYNAMHAIARGASAAALQRWREEHPEETDLYPAGYVPNIAEEYWPEWFRTEHEKLRQEANRLTNQDCKSWTVTLEAKESE